MKTRYYFFPIAILLVSFLTACDSSTNATHEESQHDHNAAATELSLNNGQKWKADAATNSNVAFLKNTTENFAANTTPAISNYQALGNELGEGLNKMIRECKMSGPDHDALHLWLEPVLKETNELKTVSDTTRAKEIFSSLKERIEAYQKFFEAENS